MLKPLTHNPNIKWRVHASTQLTQPVWRSNVDGEDSLDLEIGMLGAQSLGLLVWLGSLCSLH